MLGIGIGIGMVAVAWIALMIWLPSDAELAAMIKVEAERRLEIKVTIGSAHWSLLPQPVVIVTDLRTEQPQPVVIGRLVAQPEARALLHRKLVLDHLRIDDAVLPRESLRAFRQAPGAAAPNASAGTPLKRLEFRNVTWIPYSGIALAYDGEIEFDPEWRPRAAGLRRPATDPPFTLSLKREGEEDRWRAEIRVGGGSADGEIALKSSPDGDLALSGHLEPRDIDVASALNSFERRSPIGGKASGKTVLTARGQSVHELAGTLHTRSSFKIGSARLLHFDLDKAISTLGKEHAGQTPLEELTGQIDTQNTDQGMRVVYSHVLARHDKYTARGEATIYHRHVEASGTLDLIDGAIGVPFTMSGPTDKPKVSVPPGFFAGAVAGTAIVPGIGTVIGARVGTFLGKMVKGGNR